MTAILFQLSWLQIPSHKFLLKQEVPILDVQDYAKQLTWVYYNAQS